MYLYLYNKKTNYKHSDGKEYRIYKMSLGNALYYDYQFNGCRLEKYIGQVCKTKQGTFKLIDSKFKIKEFKTKKEIFDSL